MPQEKQPEKKCALNLRNFPKELKRRCKAVAAITYDCMTLEKWVERTLSRAVDEAEKGYYGKRENKPK